MAEYSKKHLDGDGLDYLIDQLDARYAVDIDVEVENLEYLGSTSGSEVISLPLFFTEVYCISSLNPWNNVVINIPARALHDDSPVDASTGVQGGYYYKTGSYIGLGGTNIYADAATYLVSKTKAKLDSWYHNEDSDTGANVVSNAVTHWYYRVKRTATITNNVHEYESIPNSTIDEWWYS